MARSRGCGEANMIESISHISQQLQPGAARGHTTCLVDSEQTKGLLIQGKHGLSGFINELLGTLGGLAALERQHPVSILKLPPDVDDHIARIAGLQ